ncbi:MAG: hypothetical protein M1818_001083 [Claussenomyces sp. TS43310]|nr:MAG: hypothetical protein M1818_001083 [Claussenomyces sp. TS43310]
MHFFRAFYIASVVSIGARALPTPGEADEAWKISKRGESDEAWKISRSATIGAIPRGEADEAWKISKRDEADEAWKISKYNLQYSILL